jgi:hypothetical protein
MLRGIDMKRFIICITIFLLLAQSYMALSPIELGGASGKGTMDSMAEKASNQTELLNLSQNLTKIQTENDILAGNNSNQTSKTSNEDLWSWGSVPEGYSLDKSGKLVRNPKDTEWLPGI